MNIDLKFSNPAIFPLLLLVLAFVVALLVYRRTTPPVATWLRRALGILRAFALAIVLLLLFEPVLSLVVQRSQKPVVAVLLDRSASMSLADSALSRADIARRVLAQPWLDQLRDKADLQAFVFSDSLRQFDLDSLENLKFDGDGSNLATALVTTKDQLANRVYGAAILLSDGAFNVGSNPARVAESYGVPVITVGLGSNRQARDVVLSDVVTNEIAYAETKLPVEATISAVGFQGRHTRLRLFDGDTELASQDVELPADHTQITTQLHLTPKHVGLKRYEIKIDPVDEELTVENNRRVFYVRVLKSKLTIWVFAGAPSPDYVFLKRALQGDTNFKVRGFVQRPGGSFYRDGSEKLPAFQNETSWEKVDAIVLVDFPRRDSDDRLLQNLVTQLTKQSKPLFYLHGPGVDVSALWRLRGALPLAHKPTKTLERLEILTVEAAGQSHPITRPLLEIAPGAASRIQQELPPLFFNLANLQALAGSEILLGTAEPAKRVQPTRRRMQPLWIAQKTAARKTLAIFSYGLWRWNMLLQALGRGPEMYENLVRGAVRWLVTKEDTKLVRLVSNKKIYRGGEQIELVAQVYYEDYRPRQGAHVTVTLTGPQFRQEIILQDMGSGLYRARLQVLGGGEYVFRGVAEIDGQTIGEDSGRFSVEPFNLEFLAAQIDEPLLRQIATLTGGRFVTPDSLEEVVS